MSQASLHYVYSNSIQYNSNRSYTRALTAEPLISADQNSSRALTASAEILKQNLQDGQTRCMRQAIFGFPKNDLLKSEKSQETSPPEASSQVSFPNPPPERDCPPPPSSPLSKNTVEASEGVERLEREGEAAGGVRGGVSHSGGGGSCWRRGRRILCGQHRLPGIR